MRHPGEYPQPLTRKTFVMCPVVSGYVAARLQAEDAGYPPSPSGMALPVSMRMTFENVGGTVFSAIVRETDNRAASGTRTTVVSAGTLVPGGATIVTGAAKQQYIEIYGAGLSTYFEGELRLQIESERQWREMGFDRTDPFYPTKLYQAKVIPTAI